MDRYSPPNHPVPVNTRLTAGPAPLRGGRNPDEPRDRGCAAPLSNAREADALVLERAAEILFTCSHKPQSTMLGALCKVLRGTAPQRRAHPCPAASAAGPTRPAPPT